MKTPFKLKSRNNSGGRNGKGVNFKEMGVSPVKQSDIVESFRNFMRSKQTKEGGDIGDIKQRMRHPNIEIRMQAEKENRARLKKVRGIETVEEVTGAPGAVETDTTFEPYEFTRSGDPYPYRTIEGGGYEFQSLKGKGGRTKGEWYTAKGGISDIEKAYKKSMEIEE